MINLKELAGDRFKIELDPSATIDASREERLWYYRVPCQLGFIAVYSPNRLLAHTASTRAMSRLSEVPGLSIRQRGDREVNAIFRTEQLERVAEILKARKRRRMSPENRDAAIARIEAFKFSRSPASKTASNFDARGVAG